MSLKFHCQLQNPSQARSLILQYPQIFKSLSTKRWEFLDSQYSIILREIETATIKDETQKSTTILKDHLLSLQKERKNLEAQKLSRWKIDKELSMAQDKWNLLKPPSQKNKALTQENKALKLSAREINEESSQINEESSQINEESSKAQHKKINEACPLNCVDSKND